jgi:hypothetical protein
MDLEKQIRDAAEKFAKQVVDTLRGMTLDELAGIVRLPVASTAAAPARKRTAKAAAKPVVAKAAAKAAPKPLSPKLRAFRQVQGKYAGYLRGFTGTTRERIRAINAEKGAAVALAEMRKLLKSAAPAVKPPKKVTKTAAKTVVAKPARRKLTITPARKAQLKVQGTYIGLMRSLPAAQKAAMKKLAAKSGMEAAVEVMKRGRR